MPQPPRMRAVLAVAVLAAAAAGAPGQGIAMEITPNPAPPQSQVLIKVTATSPSGVTFPYTNCLFSTIHTGPTQPPIPLLLSLCSPSTLTLAPCQSATQTFTLQPNLTAGDYWFKFRYFNGSSTTLTTEWCVLTVQGQTTATLNNLTPALVGSNLDIQLSDTNPASPNASLYLTAASLTTNSGQFGAPPVVALDNDILFNLSFPAPNPTLFINFQGLLDGSGQALMTLPIPNVSQLACTPLHFQAVVVPPSGQSYFSNVLNLVIQ